MSTQLSVPGVHLGTVLKQSAGVSRLDGGRTDADVSVRGKGTSMRSLMASLGGTVFVHVGSGSIDSAELETLGFADLMVLVNKSLGKEDHLRLNCVVSRMDLVDGIARHRTLVVDTSRVTLVGTGTTNLATETLD